jgi:hypothetical protein
MCSCAHVLDALPICYFLLLTSYFLLLTSFPPSPCPLSLKIIHNSLLIIHFFWACPFVCAQPNPQQIEYETRR